MKDGNDQAALPGDFSLDQMDEQARPLSAGARLLARTEEAARSALIGQAIDAPRQLPFWPNEMRAIPNDYARSALFTVRNKRTPREHYVDHEIFHMSGEVQITYTGPELRADDDELVWQQVLEFAKSFPLGKAVEFTMYQLCKALGWPLNGRYYDKAEECLTRLQTTSLKLYTNRMGRLESLSLVRRFGMVNRGTRQAKCHVYIEEDMAFLFAGNHYTQFLWSKYRDLTPTARRLYDYLGSHKQPYPLKLDTYHKLCASNCARPSKWAETARKACAELMDKELVRRVWVEDGSIRCVR